MRDDRHDILPLADRFPERFLRQLYLGHVGEREHRAPEFRPVDERPLGPLHGKQRAVAAPKHVDSVRVGSVSGAQRLENARVFPTPLAAIGPHRVKCVVEVSLTDIPVRVPEQFHTRAVEGDAAPIEVDSEHAVARGLEQRVHLAAGTNRFPSPGLRLTGQSLETVPDPADHERGAQGQEREHDRDPQLKLPGPRHPPLALPHRALDRAIEELGTPLQRGEHGLAAAQGGRALQRFAHDEHSLVLEMPTRRGSRQLGQALPHLQIQILGQDA